MTTDLIVRRAQLADLEGAARLGARLALMHHQSDPDRYFLPEEAERGYKAWMLGREDAVSFEIVALKGLVSFYGAAPHGASRVGTTDRGYARGTRGLRRLS